MGRNKAALRLGGRSLLTIVRRTASELGSSVRVIRRDLIKRCGPLGGIHAALTTARADAELFLACDMPFVSAGWLRKIARAHRSGALAVFSCLRQAPSTGSGRAVGFPCLISRSLLPEVLEQLATGDRSLHGLAARLDATLLDASPRYEPQLFNINTPEDWAYAQRRERTPVRG
jgi:molybdopterin-guanine dinucleotide biosynthesis protein A